MVSETPAHRAALDLSDPTTDLKSAFEQLNRTRIALEERLAGAITSLDAYADEATGGFFHLHGQEHNTAGDPSHASSATCASYLVASGNWVTTIGEEGALAPWTGRAELLARKLVHSPWSSAGLEPGNPFTVAFILEALADLSDAERMEQQADRGDPAKTVVKGDTSGVGGQAVSVEPDPDNPEKVAWPYDSPHSERCAGFNNCGVNDDAILKHWVRKLNRDLVRAEGGLRIEEFPQTAFLTYKAVRALKRHKQLRASARLHAREWALSQFRQESVAVSAQINDADPFELAYAVMTFVVTSDPQDISPQERDTVRHALQQFFASQQPDGHWPRSRALFRYPKFGMAYCYEYELLAQMLSEPLLEPFLAGQTETFAASFEALERNAITLNTAGAQGWASGHLSATPGTPESWTAASVYQFCHEFRRYVVDEIRRTLFGYANASLPASSARPDTRPSISAKDLLDCPVVPGRTLRNTLTTELLVKVWTAAERVDQGHPLPTDTPNSAIMFGPPGTSKTQLAKIVARALGWPLLQLDPSHLTRDGFDRLHAETNLLFTMLAASERMVVLLDEFDELVQSRDANDVATTSRFLTTAMLPKIAELANRRRIIYILATNHLERFDEAISRQGRFDLVLPVLPPLLQAKYERWPSVEHKINLLSKRSSGLTPSHQVVLEELTFLEFKKFAARVLDPACTNITALRNLVDQAAENATMLREPAKPGDETWATRIQEQLKQCRLEHP